MNYYPIFIDLKNRHCLVVGAGKVGQRKIKTLAGSKPGSLKIIDTSPLPQELKALLASNPNFTYEQRPFQESDLDDCSLVLVCTNNKKLNLQISKLCQKNNILCNIANAPQQGDFILPSLVKRGDLTIACVTGGQSPALARRLRSQLEEIFGPEYEPYLQLMGKIRKLILEQGQDSEDNKILFRSLVHSDLLENIKTKNKQEIINNLQNILPCNLHNNIGEIYDCVFQNF